MPLPSTEEKLDILNIHCKGLTLADDVRLETLATDASSACVGADLKLLVEEARRVSFLSSGTRVDSYDSGAITMADFKAAALKLRRNRRDNPLYSVH